MTTSEIIYVVFCGLFLAFVIALAHITVKAMDDDFEEDQREAKKRRKKKKLKYQS